MLMLVHCVLLPSCFVFDPYFVVQYLVSFLVLQSSRLALL